MPGTPAATIPAPTAPARNTVRLLTRSFVMAAVLSPDHEHRLTLT
jgi:hypothetical protein